MLLEDVIKELEEKRFKRYFLEVKPEHFKDTLQQIGNAVVSSGIFKISKHNKQVYNDISVYYIGHISYNRKKYKVKINKDEEPCIFNCSLGKGILLSGNYGSGKSDCMTIFNQISRVYGLGLHATVINCKTLENDFKAVGYEYLFRFKKGVWLLEDLGLEELQTKHFGTNDNIIESVINMLYDNWRSTQTPVFITTNLNGLGVYERYGKRLADRIFEMCNVYFLAGENLRNK